MYNRLAILHISGYRQSQNLRAVESRPRIVQTRCIVHPSCHNQGQLVTLRPTELDWLRAAGTKASNLLLIFFRPFVWIGTNNNGKSFETLPDSIRWGSWKSSIFLQCRGALNFMGTGSIMAIWPGTPSSFMKSWAPNNGEWVKQGYYRSCVSKCATFSYALCKYCLLSSSSEGTATRD